MLKTRHTCRICDCKLYDILDLGEHRLPGYDGMADCVFSKRKVPLTLSRCDPSKDQNACGLVQLRHTTPGYLLYENYFYRSGINTTMKSHLQDIANKILVLAKLDSNDLIVDIGCNDGTYLKYLADKGYGNLCGYDPAKNLVAESSKVGAKIVTDYFCSRTYQHAKGAKAISSIAMFYDLENPRDFVYAISESLDDMGVWVFEQSYLPSMLNANSVDTICHEHVEYYSFSVIERLLAEFNMQVIDVFLNSTNGGSFQVFAAKIGCLSISLKSQKRIDNLRKSEFDLAIDTDSPYLEFKINVENNKNKLLTFLRNAKTDNKKVFAYGASTKGAITLQYCGIDNDLIECCADRNPKKWGSIINGTNIPIISEEEAREKMPDYFLVLPWHFIEEFVVREQDFLKRGGQFVLPMPFFKLIGA